MQTIYELMKRTGMNNGPWWLDRYADRVLWHAHRLGIVYRQSVTQVEWTKKGVELYWKYAGWTPRPNDRLEDLP